MVSDIKVARKYNGMYISCQDKNIPFDLTLAKVRRLLNQKTCYYTKSILSNATRTIDRLDPSKGYTIDNVVACDVRINGLKSNLTPQEIKQMYQGLKRKNII